MLCTIALAQILACLALLDWPIKKGHDPVLSSSWSRQSTGSVNPNNQYLNSSGSANKGAFAAEVKLVQ
jgi:hypothetical protein